VAVVAKKPALVIAVLVVLASAGFLALAGRTLFAPGSPGETIRFSCDKCGHVWHDTAGVKPVCPRCSQPGVIRSFYACPRCKKVFLGLERKKLGPGHFLYRLAGKTEWTPDFPATLTCPHCNLTSGDIVRSSVPDPDNKQAEPTAERPME